MRQIDRIIDSFSQCKSYFSLFPRINNASQIVDNLETPIFDSKLSLRTCDSPYSDSSSMFAADEDRSRIDSNSEKYHPIKPARKTKKKLAALLEQDKHNGTDRVNNYFEAFNHDGDDGDLTSSSQIHLDDTSRTSSELMLVLVPSNGSPTKRRGTAQTLFMLNVITHCLGFTLKKYVYRLL